MRYLQGAEIAEADRYMAEAIKAAVNSPCEKSKRGIVIVKDNEIIGAGYNKPPFESGCVPNVCRDICADYCEHAEVFAGLDSLKKNKDPSGGRMYHAKIQEGFLKDCGPPSCVRCSSLASVIGIKDFVLQHKGGYGLYEMREFHELSLRSSTSFGKKVKVGGTFSE